MQPRNLFSERIRCVVWVVVKLFLSLSLSPSLSRSQRVVEWLAYVDQH